MTDKNTLKKDDFKEFIGNVSSQIIDLDANEDIDIIKINGVEYSIGDIPPSIKQRILNMTTNRKEINNAWRPILLDILKIKNKDVQDPKLWTDEKVIAFSMFIIKKMSNDKNG